MKKLLVLLLSFSFCYCVFSQTTAKITNLKDAWGVDITYVGEVKNNKPNGLGVANYTGKTASYYAGYFIDGQYSGRGVLMFSDGQFLSGTWKNGKLNGRGAYLNSTGDLFVGDFVDGNKTGNGTLMYKDNGFITGQFFKDSYEGRNIFVGAKGEILNDNIYKAGKKNGTGYQYDTETKKLFEGLWKDGEWVASQPAIYYSFLKSPAFYAEKTANQVLIGGIDRNNKNLLQDTGYLYNLKTKKRFFGVYDKGLFKSGIIIKDDSTRFVGTLGANGADGYGSFYRIGTFYDEGTYKDDYLNGPNCLSISVKNKTVYYGGLQAGKFTGKAFFVNSKKEMYVGDYVKSDFTGSGYKLKPDGSFVKGTWEKGKPVKVVSMIDAEGKPVILSPKSMSEAIGFLYTSYEDEFETVTGGYTDNSDIDNDEEFFDISAGYYNIPGAAANYVVEDPLGDYAYVAYHFTSTDLRKAAAKYNALCKSIQVLSIAKNKGAAPVKLQGSIENVEQGSPNTMSKFHLPGEDDEFDFQIAVVLKKVGSDYKVYTTYGNSEIIRIWVYGE